MFELFHLNGSTLEDLYQGFCLWGTKYDRKKVSGTSLEHTQLQVTKSIMWPWNKVTVTQTGMNWYRSLVLTIQKFERFHRNKLMMLGFLVCLLLLLLFLFFFFWGGATGNNDLSWIDRNTTVHDFMHVLNDTFELSVIRTEICNF